MTSSTPVSTLDPSTLGFSGYRPSNAAAIQPSSAAASVAATSQATAQSAFGASPYLTGHFSNSYQTAPDFSSYMTNPQSAAGWYGAAANDPRLSRLNTFIGSIIPFKWKSLKL
ncbi:unnamed protein product [Anisakis simplex]|uniref:YIF1B n=1 Tax=Anisakis simplex TaxID=6269 RepID=A0A0M3J486_ANISI|nr:unnamed protein product [Anisakis simplex]